MRYSNSEVAHKWVHGLFDGEIQGSNMYGDEKSMKSYNTVIAQCLDRDNDVFVVIDQTLTPTTSKHINYVERALHSGATVIRTHINSKYNYNNVDFLGWGGQFNKEKRLDLVTHLLKGLFKQYEYVINGKTLDATSINKKALDDIDKLDRIYDDCSLEVWLRDCKLPDMNDRKSDSFKLRRMVRLILDERSDEEITDAIFGKGTWHRMEERIAPLLKARATREERAANERRLREAKLDSYRKNLDSLRNAWREHRDSIPSELRSFSELYYGGNVLLRFSRRNGYIETSLGIQITFEECHKYWKIIKEWHDKGTFCEGLRMSGYCVNSFDNDILRAGCHKIAFCEMQRMYDELCKKEVA